MTEKFTLELTLDELHMLDKYVDYCEETKEFFDKLKNAYPKPKSPVEEAYKDAYGYYPDMEYNINSFSIFQKGYEAAQPKQGVKDKPKSKTIRDIIGRWWMDTFSIHSEWDAEECMDDLADQIEFWIMRNKK